MLRFKKFFCSVRLFSILGFLGIFLMACETSKVDQEVQPNKKGQNMDSEHFGYCSFLGEVKGNFYYQEQYKECHQYDPSRAITCCSINHGTWIDTRK